MSRARPDLEPTVRAATATLLAVAALLLARPLRAQEDADPPGRAARVNLVQGAVSLQPAGTDVWTDDVLNRPLTSGDRLWSDHEARAEIHVGSAAIRLGAESGVEFLDVDDRTVQLKQTAGTLEIRVRALGPGQTFEIDTPEAALSVLEPGDYRIDIDDAAGVLRVAAFSGQIAVTSGNDATSLRGGSQAEYSDQGLAEADVHALASGDGFDRWVLDRNRREDRAVATRYVSRELTGYEDLDDNGSWQVVDDYGPVWTPVVAVGWAPYRDGHWAWIAPWGWSWIDAAPWGFAPFHYGRWINVGGLWGWAPGPLRAVPVYAPALVGWIGRPGVAIGVTVGGGPNVGWFPLGWNEVYVPSYRASTTYVRNVNITNIHVTNEYVTNYVNGGAHRPVMGAAPGVTFRNQAIPGAITATTRGAFIGAQPVQQHRADVPREWLSAATAGTQAPPIAPSLQSVGRRAPVAPAIDANLWARPVVARGAPPPAPAPFEAQRRAVIANGGQPAPVSVPRAPRSDIVRASAAPPLPTRPAPYVAPAASPSQRAATLPGRPPAYAPPPRVTPAPPVAETPPAPSPAPQRFAPPPRPPPPPAESRPPPEPRRTPEEVHAAPREAAPPAAKPPARSPERPAHNDPRR